MGDEILYINDQISIPLSELHFQFVPSGGPGGQHANRSATQVELHFDVVGSPALSEAQREQVMAALGSRLDGQGGLRLVSGASRSQARNRQEVTDRFRVLLAQALRPRKRRRRTHIPRRERERRLADKRHRGEKKQRRRPPWPKE